MLDSCFRVPSYLLGAVAAGAFLTPAQALAAATVTASATAGALSDGPNVDGVIAGSAVAGAAVTDGTNNGSAFGEVNATNGRALGFGSADYFGSGDVDAAFDLTVSNSSSAKRTYKYKFVIDAGSVDVEYFGNFLGGDAEAAFLVQIFASHDGNTEKLFETGYRVLVDDGVTVIDSLTGTDIGYVALADGRIGVSWSQFVGTVAIPFAIDPGESFDFQYLLTAAARAEGIDPECGYGVCGGIGALANAADPGAFVPEGLGFSSVPVPAPAGAAALLGGFAGLAAGRRRRRTR